jgi:hypothetical protein
MYDKDLMIGMLQRIESSLEDVLEWTTGIC